MEGIPPIEPFLTRLAALDAKMAEPDFYSDQRTASAISREHQQLSKLRDDYAQLNNIIEQISENKAIIEENSDPEFVEMAREDVANLESQVEPLKNEILKMMLRIRAIRWWKSGLAPAATRLPCLRRIFIECTAATLIPVDGKWKT